MKIIAIMGSPKGKGSGYKIVKMIEDRMMAMGNQTAKNRGIGHVFEHPTTA